MSTIDKAVRLYRYPQAAARVTKGELAELDAIATAEDCSRGSVVRRAIVRFLAERKKGDGGRR